VSLIEEAETLTRGNGNLKLMIAFNYGGQNEITSAVRRIAREVKAGRIDPEGITPDTVAANLDTAGVPDPDLIIRTSGEKRLSNFLIWQSAYAELVFTDVFWPDFTPERLKEAVAEYKLRDRRFGAVGTAKP
jgi:undecaprenyl diphosphate synthase